MSQGDPWEALAGELQTGRAATADADPWDALQAEMAPPKAPDFSLADFQAADFKPLMQGGAAPPPTPDGPSPLESAVRGAELGAGRAVQFIGEAGRKTFNAVRDAVGTDKTQAEKGREVKRAGEPGKAITAQGMTHPEATTPGGKIAEGVGGVVPILVASAVNPVLGAGAIGATAGAAVEDVYTRTLQETGSEAKATVRAIAELPIQALYMLPILHMAGALGPAEAGLLRKALTGATEGVIGPGLARITGEVVGEAITKEDKANLLEALQRGGAEALRESPENATIYGLLAGMVGLAEPKVKGAAEEAPKAAEPAPELRGEFEARAQATHPDVSPERANYRLAKQEGAPTESYERSMSLDDAVAERMAERPDLSTNDATLEVVNENKAKAEAMLAREEEDRRQSEERRKIATGELPPEGERRLEDRRAEAVHAEPVKQPWEMNLDELTAAEDDAKLTDKQLLTKLFGEEGAKKYNRLQRTANSTSISHERSSAAYDEVEAMEATLSEVQRRKLFGIGESGATPEELTDYRKALQNVDQESPQAMGESLQWAISELGGAKSTDPAQMTPKERVRYAQVRHALEIAKENGWDPQEVIKSGIKHAASRFSDPQDALFTLRRFFPGLEQDSYGNMVPKKAELPAPVQAPPFEAPGGSKGEEPAQEIAPESGDARGPSVTTESATQYRPGATPHEAPPPTSLKEATVTEERAAIGLDPIEKVASRGYEDVVWPEATKKMQEDPGLGQRLAAEIAAKPRPLTDTEVAVLLRNKVAAHNEAGRIEADLLKAQESGDAHAVEALELQARNVSDRNVAADESIANSKRATAQGLAALRMMANEDNSLAALETKARIKAGGRPLTTDERAELRDISEKLIAAEKKIADYEAKASTPAPTKARVLSFIEAQAQAARERIKARGTRAMAGIDPVDFADRVIVGVEYLAKDIKKFADWSTAMVKEFGETIKPHLQAIFDAAKAKLAESPKEAGRLQAFKTRTAKAIKTTEEATASGDFGPKPKPKPLALDAEAIKLKTDYEEVKRRRDLAFAKYSLENRTTGQKAADVAKESVNATKQIVTSADLSAVLRQGVVFSLDPTNWKKLATDWGPKMLQATFSERKALETDVALRNRPGAAELEKAGLELTRLDGPLNKHEEHMRSNLVEKIPFIGPMVRGSNRAFTTFLNLQRAAAADRFVEAIPGEHTPERMKRLAAAVNTMTGRGEVSGSFKGAVSAASDVLWSPRLLLSRFQLLAGQPMWRGDRATRTIIAKQYARTLGGVATVYALARLAGGEVEDDPRSSDFGKIRFGNTRIDPLAGISQVSVLLARTATGETKTASGEVHPLRKPIFGEGEGPKYGQADMADIYGRFARSKLSPTLGVPLDLLSGEDVTGQPVTPADLPQKMLVPLAFQDIRKAMEEQGIPAGVAMSILSMLGMGLQTYEAKPPSAKPARRFGPRLPSLR